MAYRNLENALHDEGITQRRFAEVLGVSEKSAYNKVHGKSDFTILEYRKTCILLAKYDRDWLFKETGDGD